VSRPRVRGLNLTIKPAHANGWVDLFDEWDWDGWIRYQVDLAADAEANTIRLIGDVVGVIDGSFTLATYRARWRQLINYCESLGLAVYVCGGGKTQVVPLAAADVIAVLVGLGEEINQDPTVIGYDVIQEAPVSWAATNGDEATAAIRGVCDRRLTFSAPVLSYNSTPGGTTLAHQSVRDGYRRSVDFFDHHLHYDPAAEDLNSGYWQPENLPLIVGEFGAPAGPDQLATIDNLIEAMTTPPPRGRRLGGALMWSVVDGGVEGSYGLYADDGTVRPSLLGRFRSLPA
jgi:hypothetical protein